MKLWRSTFKNLNKNRLSVGKKLPFPISLIDLVLVPGLGFDEYGHRVGRGRGFYDRFLAHPEFAKTACGLAFETQMLASIPAGPLGRRGDMVVTDEKVRRFKG